MANNEDDNFYNTSDLGCCSALVASGFVISNLDRSSNRTVFSFVSSLQLEKAVSAYWSRALSVDAQSYFDAIKQVKARLYGDN